MILIPIGRDDAEIRRHAWVSYAIIAANILFFFFTLSMEHGQMAETQQRWRETLTFLMARPYLRPPAALKEVMRQDFIARFEERRRDSAAPSLAVMQEEQQQLNELADKAVESYRKLPLIRFGYIPANGNPLTILSSMFVHAGFLHLLGNLLIFYLSGPFVEDVFGRPLFAGLYFAGGLVASLTYAARHPADNAPLVGASGAIAAVMGAYLIRFFKSKIEFFCIPILLRPTIHFRFFLPAFVVLPFWFLQQLLEMNLEGGGGGVAFSAHVGGFVFGVLVALVVKLTRFEEQHVEPVVQKETMWAMDERLTQAMDAHRIGDLDTAKSAVIAVLREKPSDPAALRVAVDVALSAGDQAMLDNAATRLLARHMAENNHDAATELIHEVTAEGTMQPPKFLARAERFRSATYS